MAPPATSECPRWERTDGILVFVYLALAHLVFYPALAPGVFLYGRDTVFHDCGLLYYDWSQILEQGRLGLWNPYLFCGLPALGTFALCPFHPLAWLFAGLPFAPALTYQYVLNDWLAGLGTYWAARWMGLRRDAAFFGGLVFLVGGHVVTLAHAGHLQKVSAIAWVPFAFAAATAAMRTGRWKPWLWCGLALAFQLLASHLQIACYTVLVLVLWTIRLAGGGGWLPAENPESPPRPRIKQAAFGLSGLALALAVAAGLSAAQLLPALETTPLTNRGAGIPYEAVVDTSYPPLEFIEYLLPGFLGDSTGTGPPYRGQWGERIVTDYLGLLPVILFFHALVAGRRRDRWFWLAVILAAAVVACGRFTPVFRLAYDWIPGFNRFRSPATILAFVAWPAAILSAQGFEEFTGRIARDPLRRRRYLVILLSCAGALAAMFVVLVTPGLELPGLGSLDLALPRRAGSPLLTLLASLQRSMLFGALACLLLAALAASAWFLDRGSRLTWSVALAALFVLTFADPCLHETRYLRGEDARRFQLYLTSHWADSLLRALPPPVRGIEVGNELTNRMMTRGIGSLHGYHPVHLQEYVDLLDLYSRNHPQLGRLVFEQFVLAPEGKSPGGEYDRAAEENGQVLWLRRPPLHYAWFPAEIGVVGSREELLSAMGQADFDPYRKSYSSTPSLLFTQSASTTPTARVVAYSPNRIELEVATDTERPMIVAELAAPGWTWVLDNGREIAPSTANYAFRAVRIPAGNHRVALIYRPFSFRLGLYLTFFTALALLAALPASIRRKGPPRPPTPASPTS